MRYRAITVALALLAAAPAWGEEPPKGLSGEAELGLVATDGNTQTQNLNAKAKVAHEGTRWRNEAHGETVLASDDQGSTAERYFVAAKTDRKFGERSYVFVTANWEKDLFSGYEYRITEALGYGNRVVATDAVTLDLEAGPGARQSRVERSGTTDNEALGRVALNLEWKVSDTSTFTEDATSEIGSDATVTRSVTGLKTQVAGQLATKITFTVKNTTDVPPGVEETDYETAVTLVYGF
jgi:putative salt-induced outer membrane protein